MAHKRTGLKTVARGLTIKQVKKAGMWVATYPHEGKTAQKWFDKQPTTEQLNEIKELMA